MANAEFSIFAGILSAALKQPNLPLGLRGKAGGCARVTAGPKRPHLSVHSICQQIWKTQQWPQDWKRSVFIPIPKKGWRGEGAQRKRCRDPRCSPRGNPGRKLQPTPVFLPGESQGWRSLVGCRLWGRIELDTTEAFEHSLALPFFEIRLKIDLFQSCGHC